MSMTLHAIINPDTGEVEFEVEGIAGGRCKDITELLAKGHEVMKEQLTEDFYKCSTLPDYV